MANQQIKTKVQELIKSKPVFVASKVCILGVSNGT